MRKTIILLQLALLSFIVQNSYQLYAQSINTRNIDSLKKTLGNTTIDTLKLSIFLQLISNSDCGDTIYKLKSLHEYNLLANKKGNAFHILKSEYYLGYYYEYCKNDLKTALKTYEHCAELANSYNNKEVAIDAYVEMAQAYEYTAQNTHALENYHKAVNLKPSPNNLQSIYGNMGRVYTLIGDYTKAIDCYELAYSIKVQRMIQNSTKQHEDSLVLMLLLINLANVHISTNQYNEALQNYQHVQELNAHIKNEQLDIYSLEGVGRCMELNNDLITAASYFNRALQKSIAIQDNLEQSNLLNKLGNICLLQNDASNAKQYAEKALKIETSENPNKMVSILNELPDTYTLLADISKRKNDLGNALRYINRAITLYRQAARQDDESKAWNRLSNIYGQMNKPADALAAYKHYISLRDSVFSQEKAKEITRIEMNGEFGRKEMADSLLHVKKDLLAKTELQKQKRDKHFFIAGSVLLLFIAAGSVYFLVYTRRAKRQIELLMKEMHHRVKNNLQVISTLLNLQLADILDESARRLIEEGITRISSIALIHHHLYRVDNLSSIEFSVFATELLKQVSAIYIKPGQQLQQDFEIPPTRLDIDTAIPLGLVLNELMTNSFKYAYTGADVCKISIKLSHHSGNYTIQYCDYGPGLPDGFNIETAESLGMRIIQSLSMQLGGHFHYSKTDNSFVVTFKDTTLRKRVA